MGKGSGRRPRQISAEEEQRRWDAAFGKTEDHADHGLGNDVYGPDDPDCPCRATGRQAECARVGCGYCRAAKRYNPNEKDG